MPASASRSCRRRTVRASGSDGGGVTGRTAGGNSVRCTLRISSKGSGESLRLLSLLCRGELPLVAGDRRWPPPAAAPTTKRGVEADGPSATGETGTARSKVDPGRPQPNARAYPGWRPTQDESRAAQRRAAARRCGGAGHPHGTGRPGRRPRVHRREGRRPADLELPHQGVAPGRARGCLDAMHAQGLQAAGRRLAIEPPRP
jgi:hypothetical protein